MDKNQEKWNRCLQMIREKLVVDTTGWVYKTWFEPVAFERYDEAKNEILIQVPDIHVYEYLEHFYSSMLKTVVGAVFQPNPTMLYRIRKQEPTIANIVDYLRKNGYDPQRDPYNIRIANACKRMEDGLHYFLGDDYTWLPAYDQVAEWLTDNKGRGLLCVGTPGLGKSLICEKILPVILGNDGHPIPRVTGHEICQRIDELMKKRILIIDDLGKEPAEATVNYQRRRPFFELCNNAERNGNLLIINTNLSTTPVQPQWRKAYPCSIEEYYGHEVLDRLKVITKFVQFTGKSMRH